MLFNSYTFLLLFMPGVLLILWLLRRVGLSSLLVPFVTLASLAFYAWWDYRYVPLLLGSVVFNYAVGGTISRRSDHAIRKILLVVGLAGNLGLLGYFKYAGFFAHSLNSAVGTRFPVLLFVLPLGISFFTFTQIEYVVDAYRGQAPRYAFAEYALFVTFFPHLIAGPILRHHEVIPQFKDGLRVWSDEAFARGFLLLAIGLFKKVVIADALASWADLAFGSVGSLSFVDAWAGALCYTLQLYFDFSGYSDMAVGLALMLNIKIPFNFDSPYKSRSIIEFWRRWHITLSSFLRDYLYIPLGGSRKGRARTIVNLMATFILGGLWHGAGWTFIAWGVWHGTLLSVNHAWRWTGRKIPKALAWCLTFVAVVVGWVVFRSPSMGAARHYLQAMVGVNGFVLPSKYVAVLGLPGESFARFGSLAALPDTWFEAKLASLVVLMVFVIVLPNSQQLAEKMRPTPRWLAFAAVVFLSAFLLIGRVTTFIYYQF